MLAFLLFDYFLSIVLSLIVFYLLKHSVQRNNGIPRQWAIDEVNTTGFENIGYDTEKNISRIKFKYIDIFLYAIGIIIPFVNLIVSIVFFCSVITNIHDSDIILLNDSSEIINFFNKEVKL
jgi:hypothetical protein